MIHGNMNTKRGQSGFTLVELMLAMAFVSMLLLAIAMTVIQIGNIYSKGMALKDINQSSRSLSSDMQRTVASAGGVSLGAGSYLVRPATGTPISGRLCLGNYTYLWNTVDATASNTHTIKSGGKPITFVRVPDTARKYCTLNAAGTAPAHAEIAAADAIHLTDIFVKGDHTLSLTNFSIKSGSSAYNPKTGQRLFTVNYGIGTGKVGAMTSNRTACRMQGEPGADPTYCNVQQFSLVVRSGGAV